MPMTSSRRRWRLLSGACFNCSRKFSRFNPSRANMALWPEAMPTTLSWRRSSRMSFSRCWRICSIRLLPTVPTPQMKRLSTWYSLRKKESWITFSALRRYSSAMTKEMFVSLAPWAQAITLIPLRPSVPNSLPAMPGVCFMFSPTMATVARPPSAIMGYMAPSAISWANSSLSTRHASLASTSRTPMEVLFSLLA